MVRAASDVKVEVGKIAYMVLNEDEEDVKGIFSTCRL